MYSFTIVYDLARDKSHDIINHVDCNKIAEYAFRFDDRIRTPRMRPIRTRMHRDGFDALANRFLA